MNYKRVQIGEITTLRQGFAINKNTKHHMSDEPTSLHLLRIGDMKDGTFSIFVKDTIPQHFIATNEDIIYTRTGQVGLVFRNQNGVVHNNCFTVSPLDDTELSRDFLYYVLQTKEFYDEANSKASGAAQPDLAHGSFKSIEIPLPPLETQHRIASILSAYDDLIENNQKQIKLLEEAAQRLYKEWFVDLHFPGWEETKIVDGLPEGWEKKTILDMSSVLRRGISPKYNDKGKYIVINQKCIRQTIMDIKESRQQEKEYPADMNLKDSDIVICSTGSGTLGRVGQVFGDYPDTTFDSHVTLVRAKKPAHSQFLFLTLKYLQPLLMTLGQGSTNQLELPKRVIESHEIICPTEKLILDFESAILPIHNKITSLVSIIKNATEALDRLLPKLMSGELEV